MDTVKIVLKQTDTPEVQRLLQELEPEKDVLVTVGDLEDSPEGLEVQYIKPINDMKKVGIVPAEYIYELMDKFGENISLDIVSYEVTYKDGVYGLVVELSVTVYEEDEEEKGCGMPLIFLLMAGLFTGLATIIFFICRLIKRK